MKIFKKNQVIVAVIGLMLIAAGYLNFTNQAGNEMGLVEAGALLDAEQMAGIGDATLVSTTPKEINVVQNEVIEENTNDKDKQNETTNEIAKDGQKTNENKGKNIENEDSELLSTNSSAVEDEYYTSSRLERETMYSKRLASYQEMLDKTNISETQRETAQKEITKINEEQNAIMIAENLLKTKGFEDLIIFINDESINVVVKVKELKAEQIAQIQNMITREFKAKIENIHITAKE